MARRKEPYTKVAIASDAVGLTFFILANIVVFIGEVTDVFVHLAENHGGVRFVYEYMCPIVYPLVLPIIGEKTTDMVSVLLVAEFVIILSAFVYRWICFLALKLLSLLIV